MSSGCCFSRGPDLARASELAGNREYARLPIQLKWSSHDLQYGILSFRDRKLRRPTIVALHPDFADWIAKQSGPGDTDAYVFRTLASRSGAGRNGLSRAFERIMERARVKPRLIRQPTGEKAAPCAGFRSTLSVILPRWRSLTKPLRENHKARH